MCTIMSPFLTIVSSPQVVLSAAAIAPLEFLGITATVPFAIACFWK
jgi:hypothetical protein